MASDYVLPQDIGKVCGEKNIEPWVKLLHLNARSVQPKRDEISALLISFKFKFDVVMFTETWYNNDSEFYVPKGFTHFYLNRTDSRGGGVCILTAFTGCEMMEL